MAETQLRPWKPLQVKGIVGAVPLYILIWLAFLLALMVLSNPARAFGTITRTCPTEGIQTSSAGFQPGGLILTSFDGRALWLYNIDTGTRYPLPDTVPCTRNCRLSPDFRSITFFDDNLNAFSQMRLDGTGRRMIIENAADVEWWGDGVYLIWTPGHGAFLLTESTGAREPLNVTGVTSIQPGGRWGVRVAQQGDAFNRTLVNLSDLSATVELGLDMPYFNAQSWSHDGRLLAYVAPIVLNPTLGMVGSELYTVAPDTGARQPLTNLAAEYGPARINGLAVGELAWSPDGGRIAFWVTPLTGPNPQSDAGEATIHVVEVATGNVMVYCGFSTSAHTPNPPRLLWSPTGTHLAFAGRVEGSTGGTLLLALNTIDGTYTSLSEGIAPALGAPDVVAWGLPPG
jgi:hypothetical protein